MLDVRYIAGLFDGEGWVVSNKSRIKGRRWPSFQVTAGIAMTYRPVVEAIYHQYDGWYKGDNSFRRKNPANRTIYRWYVSSVMAERFLSDIAPFLIVKKEQADIALQLQRHMAAHKSEMTRWNLDETRKAEIYAYREQLADQIRALKKVNYDLPVESDPILSDGRLSRQQN